MKKFFGLFFLLGSFLFSTSAFADHYMKSRVMNGMGENETWTSGKKQRMVTHSSMMEGVMSPPVEIIRADKGVKWSLDTKLKMYQETSLAIDYKPGEKLNNEEQKAMDLMMKEFDAAGKKASEDPCSNNIVLPEKHTFAGIPAEGFRTSCPKPNEAIGTMWIAAKGNRIADQITKEIEIFEKAHNDAMYAKYPAEDRKFTDTFMKGLGSAMSTGMMGFPNPVKLPKRMMLAMEQRIPNPEPGTAMQDGMQTEVVAVNIDKADPSLFEIPEGFTKVANLSEVQSQQMMNKMMSGEMKFSGLVQNLSNTGVDMGMPLKDAMNAGDQEGVAQFDQYMQKTAQGVNEEMMMQGHAPVAAKVVPQEGESENQIGQGTQALSAGRPEPWQQGLYDQRNTQPAVLAAPQPNVYAQPYAPQNGQPQYIPQNRGMNSQAPASGQSQDRMQQMTQMMQAGSQLVGQISQVASQFQGGGGDGLQGMMGGSGWYGDHSGSQEDYYESSGDSSDYQGYEDSSGDNYQSQQEEIAALKEKIQELEGRMGESQDESSSYEDQESSEDGTSQQQEMNEMMQRMQELQRQMMEQQNRQSSQANPY